MHFSYNIIVTKGSDIMKFLFKLLVLPALSILAVPAIFLASTYKSVEVPADFSGTATSFDMTAMITEEVDAFLVIGNRFHSLCASLSVNKPVFLIDVYNQEILNMEEFKDKVIRQRFAAIEKVRELYEQPFCHRKY